MVFIVHGAWAYCFVLNDKQKDKRVIRKDPPLCCRNQGHASYFRVAKQPMDGNDQGRQLTSNVDNLVLLNKNEATRK